MYPDSDQDADIFVFEGQHASQLLIFLHIFFCLLYHYSQNSLNADQEQDQDPYLE
jgi:hypothetical protein